MAKQQLSIVIDVDYDSKTVKQAKKDAEEFGDAVKDSGEKSNDFSSKLKAARGEVDKFTVGLVAAGKFLKTVFEAANEGFALTQLSTQFDKLTASIHTTSDAMLNDLSRATKGQVADSDLMATANQIISLKLADTHDGVVRLATAVTSLGLDMQQVTLTLANDSTARLDSLGLSIERVTELQKEFVAAGQESSKAFDSAVLVALEERMSLLGVAAGGAVNPLQQVSSEFKNITDTGKTMLFEGLNPALTAFAAMVNQVGKNVEGKTGTRVFRAELDETTIAAAEMASSFDNAVFVSGQFGAAIAEVSFQVTELNAALKGVDVSGALTEGITGGIGAGLAQRQEEIAAASQAAIDASQRVANAISASNVPIQEQNNLFEQSADVINNTAAAYKNLAFEQLLAAQGVNEATLAFGVALGILTESQAASRLEFVETSSALEVLAQSQEFALLTTEQQIAAYNLLASGQEQNAQTAIAMAMSNNEVEQSLSAANEAAKILTGTLEDIPSEIPVTVNVTVNGLRELANLPTGTGADQNAPQAQQFGGIAMGGMSLVGERGPELVSLPRGANVTTNHNYNLTLQSAASSAGVIQDFNTMRALAG